MLNINTTPMTLTQAEDTIETLQEIIEKTFGEATGTDANTSVQIHLALSIALAAMEYMRQGMEETGDDEFSIQYEYSEDAE